MKKNGASRAVLAWRLSNPMDTAFCVDALDEAPDAALARFGRPDIFNTDQGSQFTSAAFTGRLTSTGTAAWIRSYNAGRPHQVLAGRAPMAVWREGVTGVLADNAVDMIPSTPTLLRMIFSSLVFVSSPRSDTSTSTLGDDTPTTPTCQI